MVTGGKMNWLIFAWGNRLSILLGAALIIISFNIGRTTGLYSGRNEGIRECQAKQNEQTLTKVIKNESKKQEIRGLDDDVLVRRYCKWVYDIPYDECVRTVVPVR
jgi:hypothetical protein